MTGTAAPEERELKLRCPDHEALRQRLAGLDAERLAPSSFEDNQVFDRQGELAGGQNLLRLRRDRQGARLTFKGPARFEGGTKIRIERETRVQDGDELEAILESLGYAVARRYQKWREEWRLGAVVIALDHTPIGDFAEFEGVGAESLARRCGFDPATAERGSYLELYEAYRLEHPEAPPEMVFP